MANKLQQFFPMIREKETILQEIKENPKLSQTYCQWSEEQQEEFLNFCSGTKGIKMLYDSFFKELMNPEYVPERFNDFLSELLGKQVKVLTVLPNDSTRIGAESSLVIMDVVVQLEDGSIANVEVQKIGYRFPGERSACYSADLLLRQYKRVRGERKKQRKRFQYSDIKDVYTIVLFETSSSEFHKFPEVYLHKFHQVSDSGLELKLLQKYLFIPLDIFREIKHNEAVRDKCEAWLTFLSSDEPDKMIEVMEAYPEFKKMYQELYEMCLNIERVMEMFSKELRELDRNTVQYMIDEMQETIDELRSEKADWKSREADWKSEKADLESERAKLLARIAELEGKTEN